MNTLRNASIIGLLSFLFVAPAFAEVGQQKTIIPWNKMLIAPPDDARYTNVSTPEQNAEINRQIGLIHPGGPPFPVEHKVAAAEQEALQKLINRKIEAVLQPGFFSPAAGELTTFHRKKTDDARQPRSLKFHVSYKVNGYRVAINGGVASMKVESIRVFIGRVNEYPVTEEVFKMVPTTLTKENIRVREGETLKIQTKAEITELKALAAEFRDLK